MPHNHDKPPDVFPQIRYGENYCRNAGGDEPVPWCFTTDPLIRWEHCDIPVCGGYNQNVNNILSIKKFYLKTLRERVIKFEDIFFYKSNLNYYIKKECFSLSLFIYKKNIF